MTDAAAWAARRRADPVLRLMRRRAIRRLVAGLPRGAAIVDLGCGPGDDAAALAGAGFRVAAVDRDPRMRRLAAARCARWIRRGRVRIGIAPPARCDAVFAFHAADHPPGLAAFARACGRMLRSGGRAAFTATMRWSWQALPTGRMLARSVPVLYAGRRTRVAVAGLGAVLDPFRDRFRVLRIEPLGLLLPGAALFPGAGRRIGAGVLDALDRLESRLAIPLAARFADHALVIVERR